VWQQVAHQGSRYQVSCYVVPFLRELIADPTVPGRDDLVYLLSAIAIGDDDDKLRHGMPVEKLRAVVAAAEGCEPHRLQAADLLPCQRWLLTALTTTDTVWTDPTHCGGQLNQRVPESFHDHTLTSVAES
jgi:hypothetical protein